MFSTNGRVNFGGGRWGYRRHGFPYCEGQCGRVPLEERTESRDAQYWQRTVQSRTEASRMNDANSNSYFDVFHHHRSQRLHTVIPGRLCAPPVNADLVRVPSLVVPSTPAVKHMREAQWWTMPPRASIYIETDAIQFLGVQPRLMARVGPWATDRLSFRRVRS